MIMERMFTEFLLLSQLFVRHGQEFNGGFSAHEVADVIALYYRTPFYFPIRDFRS